MKRKTLVLLVAIMILGLVSAACANNSAPSSNNNTTNNAQDNASLSQVNILLVGTLKLENTDQALTADEAASLLPLWQAYRSLSSSQTAAEAEVDALLNQIESTMTADQVQAIKAMNLTNQDMLDLMQSMGGGFIPRGTPNPQSTPGFDFPSGNLPPGDFQSGGQGNSSGGSSGGTSGNRPSGGGPIPGGGSGPLIIQGGPVGDAGSAAGLTGSLAQGTPDPSLQATAQARFSTQASQVNVMLLTVLINKLEAMTTK